MKILTVVGKISNSEVLTRDAVGREYTIMTQIPVSVGESVIVVSGVVVGKTRTPNPTVYEV